MKRVNLPDMYRVPDFYQPPMESELHLNTQYPNLNSLEYRIKINTNNTKQKMQKFYESFDVNDFGCVVIACNDLRGRLWNGSFWGFESIDDIDRIEKASYKLDIMANITNIKYAEPTMLLVTDTNGALHLWSTKAEARSVGYCLFNIGSLAEHTGIVESLETFPMDYTKALTGSSDGCLKVWDMGTGDLTSLNTYRHAHCDSITGITAKPSENCIFATSSIDKSFSIWDYRLVTPVINYNDNGKYGYTTICWTQFLGHSENIYLGDDTGRIYSLDIRNIKKFQQILKLYDSPIRKIQFKNTRYAVVGCSNKLLVIDTAQNHKIIYENHESEDCVRDVHWTDEGMLCSIGWDGQLRKHFI